MALLFAYVIFFVYRRSSLFIKYKQGPTENTFAYCRTYTKHRGHFFEKGTKVPAYQDIGQLSASKLPIAVLYPNKRDKSLFFKKNARMFAYVQNL